MNTKLYPTLNDLPEVVRVQMIDLLNLTLSDIIDLGMQAKYAHWNVKGPNFAALHELYDGAADELEAFADELAERAVELGGVAQGLLQEVANGSRIPPFPGGLQTGRGFNAALSKSMAVLAAHCRTSVESATKAGDVDTADLFTALSRCVDKLLWKVEAHLQADG